MLRYLDCCQVNHSIHKLTKSRHDNITQGRSFEAAKELPHQSQYNFISQVTSQSRDVTVPRLLIEKLETVKPTKVKKLTRP